MKSRVIQTQEIDSCVCGRKLNNEYIATIDHSYGTCSNHFVYKKCFCGSFVLNNRPIEQELNLIYPETYDAYAPSTTRIVKLIRRINFQKKLKVVKEISRPNTWIDFGSGAGEFANLLFDNGLESVFAIDLGSENSFDNSTGVKYLSHSELSRISESSVDAVSMLQVIEHLPNPSETLRLLAGKLVANGVLLIETPSPSGFDFKIGKNGTWGGWHAPRHFYIFSQNALVKLLTECGFTVVKHRYIPSPYLWAETLKACTNSSGSTSEKKFFTIRNPLFICVVAFLDFISIRFSLPTSNQRIIAMKSNVL